MSAQAPPKILAAVYFSATAIAQAPTQHMIDLSVRVIGAVQRAGQVQPVWTGAGFLLDAKHVATLNDCCGTQNGVQKVAVVAQGKNAVIGRPVWSGPGGAVILELQKPMQTSGATLAPMKFTRENQPVYTVLYPKDVAPTISETKIQGAFKPDGTEDERIWFSVPNRAVFQSDIASSAGTHRAACLHSKTGARPMGRFF